MSTPLNNYLLQDITKIDCHFSPCGYSWRCRDSRLYQHLLRILIDTLGEKSAKAQGLKTVITTSERVRTLEHMLYLLKDANANGGQGELIGMLKVGYKQLYFTYDNNQTWHGQTLCVLDFYVVEEYQRQGQGKRLFDYMLSDSNKTVDEIAIDRPSVKLENFLKKNYGVEKIIRHGNNYAVTPNFYSAVPQRMDPNLGSTQCVTFELQMCPKNNNITMHFSSDIVSILSMPQLLESWEDSPHPDGSLQLQVLYTARTRLGIIKKKTSVHVASYFGLRYFRTNREAPSDEQNISDHDLSSTPELEIVEPDVPDLPEVAKDIEITETVPEEYKNHERPSTLEVRPLSQTETNVGLTPAGSTSDHPMASLTDRGYFDVKYYHNKLW